MYDFLVQFFAGFDAAAVFLYVVVGLISLVQGLNPGLSLFNWVKMRFGIEDVKANILVMVLSLTLAVIALIVTNAAEWSNIEPTAKSILELGGVAYAMAQLGYQKFKADNLYDPEHGMTRG